MPRSDGLLQYDAALDAYLARHDVPLLDITDADAITIGLYADGDHVTPEAAPLVASLFARQLAPYLPDAAQIAARLSETPVTGSVEAGDTIAEEPPGNLIANPGFQDWPSDSVVPASWHHAAASGAPPGQTDSTIEPYTFEDGVVGVRQTWHQPTGPSSFFDRFGTSVQLKPGTKYRLTITAANRAHAPVVVSACEVGNTMHKLSAAALRLDRSDRFRTNELVFRTDEGGQVLIYATCGQEDFLTFPAAVDWRSWFLTEIK